MVKNLQIDKWKIGDTFAFPISKETFPEYEKRGHPEYLGRYIILILTEEERWPSGEYRFFYVKLTPDNHLPTTKEKIEKLDFVKIEAEQFIYANYEFSEGVKEAIPDEEGFVYQYKLTIFMKKRADRHLIYLGNFHFSNFPMDEFLVERPMMYGCCFKFLSRSVIRYYHLYNLRESRCFEPEYIKNRVDYFPEWVEKKEKHKKFMEAFDTEAAIRYLNSLGIDVENEVQKDSETYVGGQKK